MKEKWESFNAIMLSADFEENTITFKLDQHFWDSRMLIGSLKASYIESPNILPKTKKENREGEPNG